MASCDDDFSLLAADEHNHHLHHHHHPPQFPHHRVKITGNSENDAVFDVSPYETEFDPDPSKARVCDNNNNGETGKRKDRDDLSDGGTTSSYGSYKKSKPAGAGAGAGVGVIAGGGEYRKDREEWSDSAIECLLDAYTEKHTQLNRGNLRGRDWEEVAVIVSERCENQTKSVEQCKNKVDNLKKRYKLERHRMSSAGISVSHWPWYKKMEAIVGNSLTAKAASDEDKLSGSAGNGGRPQKRYCIIVNITPMPQERRLPPPRGRGIGCTQPYPCDNITERLFLLDP